MTNNKEIMLQIIDSDYTCSICGFETNDKDDKASFTKDMEPICWLCQKKTFLLTKAKSLTNEQKKLGKKINKIMDEYYDLPQKATHKNTKTSNVEEDVKTLK